jgi:hypothetical protein
MIIEDLGRDAHGKVSSQPTIKVGKNRGWRRKEVGGTWTYCSGYCYEARQETKFPHVDWIKSVQQLGHRVGKCDYEGVRNFYIFMENKK